ncbi:hypothetical protein ACFTWH_29005 [Streptomyces sp. NPDC057011]|uniref:hypothetical protein n=1 Tax=unclassified Streptomyces TaxID=2593676 RepID=UPI00363DBCBF
MNAITKSRRLKAARAVVAAAAALAAGRFAMGALLGGPDDMGRYDLVPPAAFQGLTLQDSGPRVDAIRKEQGEPKPGRKRVVAVYADQAGTAQLVISGTAGRFNDEDPGAHIAKVLKGMGTTEAEVTAHEAGEPGGGALRCAVLAMAEGPLPMCIWGDHSTTVTVTVPIENAPVTLDSLAERARELRAVMEVRAS